MVQVRVLLQYDYHISTVLLFQACEGDGFFPLYFLVIFPLFEKLFLKYRFTFLLRVA